MERYFWQKISWKSKYKNSGWFVGSPPSGRPDGKNSIEARYEDETIWLTQKLMGELFEVGTNTINYHLKEIFKSGEIEEDSVIRKFRITAKDGKRKTMISNKSAIIKE